MEHKNIADTATVTACTRADLGVRANEVTEWRTRRYLEAGFYDEASLAQLARVGRSPETSQSDDYEIVAWSNSDEPITTISMRTFHGDTTVLTSSTRPSFGFEGVHGQDWLSSVIVGADSIPVHQVWELGRFLKNRRIDCGSALGDALGNLIKLILELRASGRVRFLVGEVEPDVALKHIEALGVPVTVGPRRHSPDVTGVLGPRYKDRTVVPFVIDLDQVPEMLITAMITCDPVAA